MTSTRFQEGSVFVGPESQPGESRIRRLAVKKDALVTQPWEGIDVVPDIIDFTSRTYGDKPGMGWRDIVEIVEEEKEVKKTVGGKEVTEKKTWKYFKLSDYQYLSCNEVKSAILEVARGLVDIGIKKSDIVNIYAATSINWQLISHGCATIATPIATAYDTLGPAGLQHSLNEPLVRAMFTNADLLPVVASIAANVPTLSIIIYDGTPTDAAIDKLKAAREGIQLMSIDQLRERGRPISLSVLDERRPVPDDLAFIMYTSGTMGPPKGAMITHRNLIASVGAVYHLLGHMFRPSDVYLAYLPLAHILEFVVELALYFAGMTFGYGRVKTLTDQSVRGCVGDLRALRPTIMVGVPAVWEMIRKGIMGQINKGGPLTKTMFNGAYTVKKAGVPVLSQLADATVFKKVRAATGGRLRYVMSGGSPLSRDTQEFLTTALVTVLQGYGMTESCGMCAILPEDVFSLGNVGLPVPSIEIKFKDVPEAGYLATNDPPSGEVCIRGPSVIKSYYKRDDLNNDESIFTKDGWFRTGDIGRWNANGTISLVDRIKNLIKLQGGEYIALEHLEATYKSSDLVANICVHADQNAKQPIAIIIPNEPHLRHQLKNSGPSGVDSTAPLADLCHNKLVQEFVLKQCNTVGKKAGLNHLEQLQAVILTPDEWTAENGIVTAAQKLQRRKVAEKYADQIKEVYSQQS